MHSSLEASFWNTTIPLWYTSPKTYGSCTGNTVFKMVETLWMRVLCYITWTNSVVLLIVRLDANKKPRIAKFVYWACDSIFRTIGHMNILTFESVFVKCYSLYNNIVVYFQLDRMTLFPQNKKLLNKVNNKISIKFSGKY